MTTQFSPLDPLIPILVMFVKQSGFPQKWNALLALAVYAIWTAVSLGLGLRGVQGEITPEVFISTLVVAATTGYVSYQLFYRGLLEDRITDATSFVKGPVSEPIDLGGPDNPAPDDPNPAPAPVAPEANAEEIVQG